MMQPKTNIPRASICLQAISISGKRSALVSMVMYKSVAKADFDNQLQPRSVVRWRSGSW